MIHSATDSLHKETRIRIIKNQEDDVSSKNFRHTLREEVSSTRETLDPISSTLDCRSTKFVSGNGIDSAERTASSLAVFVPIVA